MSPEPEPRRTRLAAFGSIAAVAAIHDDRVPSPAVGAVLEQVYDAIAASAPAIAAPIVDRAVREQRITRVERHELLRELVDPRASGATAPESAVVSLSARRVLWEALAAVRQAAPAIAAPILDAAVADERVTRAQRQRVLERLRTSPGSALRNRAAHHQRILSV